MGLLVLSFLLATLFIAYRDTGVSLPEFLAIRVKLSNCVTSFVLLAVWHGLFSLCRLSCFRRVRLSDRHGESAPVVPVFRLYLVFRFCFPRFSQGFPAQGKAPGPESALRPDSGHQCA